VLPGVLTDAVSGGTDLDTLRALFKDVRGFSNPGEVKGLISPRKESIVIDKEAAVDLSNLDEGYIFANYSGPKDGAILEIYYEDNKTPLKYDFEIGTGWKGYALPKGSGAYKVKFCAFDEADYKTSPEDTSTFTFDAEFSEDAPYKYENAYVEYYEDSPLTYGAAYLIKEVEEERTEPLTDREKAEIIVRFVKQNIKDDPDLLKTINEKELTRYFPKADAVFDSGKGVCGERAILAAAMLKSMGIPVKVYHGYIRDNQNGEKGSKIYHAWIGVYIEEQWIMYDPSLSDDEIIDGKSISGRTYYLKAVKPY
jgi:hypothetical protein